MLKRRGVKHEVLNAKFHEKEAPIVAQAGRTGAVTIATNMAGRGTDILLGGNPAGLASEMLHRRGLNPAEVDKETYDAALAEAKAICDEEHENVVAVGGLHIIGTERHDSRRIDNQLRGRAGRQGDPGSSRFYLSLEDDLMKRFASDRVAGLMERLGLEEDMAIESRLVSKTIESAQTRVEGYNFDIRKRVVEYDDVINKQRETIYEERDKVLRNEDLTDTIQDFVDQEIDAIVDRHLPPAVPRADWNMAGSSRPPSRHMGLGSPETTTKTAVGLRQRARPIAIHLKDMAAERLEQKDEENRDDWPLIERLVLLRTIDSIWVEHLTEIDEMRQGIGLRGFAQEDPLNAFKKEAFGLFEEMSALIRHQVATTIFRVSHRPPAAASARGYREPRARGAGRGGRGSPGRSSAAGAGAGAGAACRRGRRASPAQAAAGRTTGRRLELERSRRQRQRGRPPRLLAGRRAHGPQRPLLVRLRHQVQEVPRPVTWKARLRDLVLVALAFALGSVALTAYTVSGSGRSASRTAAGTWTPSSSSARPSTTAAPRRPSRRGSTTPSSCTRRATPPIPDHAAATCPATASPRPRRGAATPWPGACPRRRSSSRRPAPRPSSRIRNVRALFDAHGLHTALFVSDRSHMLRVLRLAAGPGHRGLGVADETSPDDNEEPCTSTRSSTSWAGWASTPSWTGPGRPRPPRRSHRPSAAPPARLATLGATPAADPDFELTGAPPSVGRRLAAGFRRGVTAAPSGSSSGQSRPPTGTMR